MTSPKIAIIGAGMGGMAAAGTLLNLAVCNEKIGKIASAWGEFRDSIAEARKQNRPDREQHGSGQPAHGDRHRVPGDRRGGGVPARVQGEEQAAEYRHPDRLP